MRYPILRSGPTLDQVRGYGGLLATILFQLCFPLAAVAQSQAARYRVYETVEGALRYHTESAPIAPRVILLSLVLIALEMGLWALLKRLFEASPTAVLAPIFILLTISVVYQCYITAPSASLKHFLTILLGLAGFLAAIPLAKLGSRAYIPARYLRRGLYGIWMLCGLNIVLGFLNLTNGSAAFIQFLGVSLQPGELLKLTLILFAGLSFVQLKEDKRLRRLFLATMAVAFCTLLVVRDVGNALILAAVALLLFYLVCGLLPALTAAAGGAALALTGYQLLTIVAPNVYILKRVADVGRALTSPEANDNLRQALLAVVRGGIFGKGLEHSLYATGNYAARTDFCFDAIVSIFGIGLGVLIVGCYMAMLLANRALLHTSRHDAAQFTFANLMTGLLCVQALVHIGGNLNLIPLTGVCLPLISSGGTNMLTTLLCLGFAAGCRLSEPASARLEEGTARLAGGTARRLRPLAGRLRGRLSQLRKE